MSAPGIQLSSEPYRTYFQPTIRQYLQGIKDAIASNNLPAAQQAFADLRKAIPSPAQGTSGHANELATSVGQGLQALGQALETGDLTAAHEAVGGIRANIQSMSEGQPLKAAIESASGVSDASPAEGTISEGGPHLNVRA